MKRKLSRVLSRLLDWIFPPKCIFCQTLLLNSDDLICPVCQTSLPWLLDTQAHRTGEFYTLCVSPLAYRDKVRESFHRYKFQGFRHYAQPYGRLMAQCVQDHNLADCDLITWAPLSPRRLRKRGYDQASLLAQVLGQHLNLPVTPTLSKIRHSKAQSSLGTDPATRRANVLGGYTLHPKADVAGKRILLVDDVITTSATLSECARILCTAGAAEVVCVTLAQAKGDSKEIS